MTPALALLLATTTIAAPVDLLQQVRDRYRSLSSFAMQIEHQDSSGLFPGRYTQTLKWRRGGHFELRVASKGNRRVPDYYADGKQVLSIQPGNVWMTGELMPDARADRQVASLPQRASVLASRLMKGNLGRRV